MGDPIDSGEIATRESANVSDFVEACAGNGQSEFSGKFAVEKCSVCWRSRSDTHPTRIRMEPVVFKPYREIGCYSSNAPIYALSRGSRSLLACPIGDSFQILEVRS